MGQKTQPTVSKHDMLRECSSTNSEFVAQIHTTMAEMQHFSRDCFYWRTLQAWTLGRNSSRWTAKACKWDAGDQARRQGSQLPVRINLTHANQQQGTRCRAAKRYAPHDSLTAAYRWFLATELRCRFGHLRWLYDPRCSTSSVCSFLLVFELRTSDGRITPMHNAPYRRAGARFTKHPKMILG